MKSKDKIKVINPHTVFLLYGRLYYEGNAVMENLHGVFKTEEGARSLMNELNSMKPSDDEFNEEYRYEIEHHLLNE